MKDVDSIPALVRRTTCPCCDSTQISVVYRNPYDSPRMREYMELCYQGHVEYGVIEGGAFELAECLDCGLIFQTSVLNPAGMQRLYDVWIDPALAEQWDEEIERNRALMFARLNFAQRLLGKPDLVFLDYGAGFGDVCMMAKGCGFETYALEFSAERISTLARRGISTVRPEADEQGRYDFVYLSEVLEHLAEPVVALREAHRRLRTGGLLFVSVPDCRRLKRSLRSVDALPPDEFKSTMLLCTALQHINCFTRRALTMAAKRVGFKIVFHPFLFIGCNTYGTTPREIAKNLIRPFYNHLTTTFYFEKS